MARGKMVRRSVGSWQVGREETLKQGNEEEKNRSTTLFHGFLTLFLRPDRYLPTGQPPIPTASSPHSYDLISIFLRDDDPFPQVPDPFPTALEPSSYGLVSRPYGSGSVFLRVRQPSLRPRNYLPTARGPVPTGPGPLSHGVPITCRQHGNPLTRHFPGTSTA
jgi:hypothetical protein